MYYSLYFSFKDFFRSIIRLSGIKVLFVATTTNNKYKMNYKWILKIMIFKNLVWSIKNTFDVYFDEGWLFVIVFFNAIFAISCQLILNTYSRLHLPISKNVVLCYIDLYKRVCHIENTVIVARVWKFETKNNTW